MRMLAATSTYRIAIGPRAGQKPLTAQGDMPLELRFEQDLCAETRGSNPHAAVRCEADARRGLERPCSYIMRPALAYERVRCDASGEVVFKLKAS